MYHKNCKKYRSTRSREVQEVQEVPSEEVGEENKHEHEQEREQATRTVATPPPGTTMTCNNDSNLVPLI